MKRLLILIIWILVVLNFFFGWAVWHILSGGRKFSESSAELILKIARSPSDFYHNFIVIDEESTIIDEKGLPNGLNYNDKIIKKNPLEYILLSTVNRYNLLCEVQLINLKSNKIVKCWQPNFNELDLGKISKSNTRIIHPQFFNGDIICNINNHIVRLNKYTGKIIWQSAPLFHHSIEIDSKRTFWVCGSLKNNKSNNFIKNYILDDALFNINPDNGQIIYQKSIYDILIENGYEQLFYLFGITEKDPIHVNDIQPALIDGKYWKKGDLLISMRHLSTVFLYRPSSNKVLWLKTGPWLNQHDCDFLNEHQIGIFGNDVIRVFNKTLFLKDHNNQYIYDFETNNTSTPYSKMFKEGKIGTLSEGRSRILPNGDLYVEETNQGRILFGNEDGVYATYVSRLDKDHIAMLGWSRYYTKEELEKEIKLK